MHDLRFFNLIITLLTNGWEQRRGKKKLLFSYARWILKIRVEVIGQTRPQPQQKLLLTLARSHARVCPWNLLHDSNLIKSCNFYEIGFNGDWCSDLIPLLLPYFLSLFLPHTISLSTHFVFISFLPPKPFFNLSLCPTLWCYFFSCSFSLNVLYVFLSLFPPPHPACPRCLDFSFVLSVSLLICCDDKDLAFPGGTKKMSRITWTCKDLNYLYLLTDYPTTYQQDAVVGLWCSLSYISRLHRPHI